MDAERIFVYGTLQRGQLREHCWPHKPVSVTEAFVLACLYDLGEYPAITVGGDRVAGEVWTIRESDAPETLAMLDQIEGYSGRPEDLYERCSVTAKLLRTGQEVDVFTYFFARGELLEECRRVCPSSVDGLCRWPGK